MQQKFILDLAKETIVKIEGKLSFLSFSFGDKKLAKTLRGFLYTENEAPRDEQAIVQIFEDAYKSDTGFFDPSLKALSKSFVLQAKSIQNQTHKVIFAELFLGLPQELKKRILLLLGFNPALINQIKLVCKAFYNLIHETYHYIEGSSPENSAPSSKKIENSIFSEVKVYIPRLPYVFFDRVIGLSRKNKNYLLLTFVKEQSFLVTCIIPL